MDENQVHFRHFLIEIGELLSNEDRSMLTFLLANDLPRRTLDNIAQNNRTPFNEIWEALISRGKISPDDVGYLIQCFRQIRRLDIVKRLEKYSPPSKTASSQGSSKKSSDLFVQYNP